MTRHQIIIIKYLFIIIRSSFRYLYRAVHAALIAAIVARHASPGFPREDGLCYAVQVENEATLYPLA